MPGPRRSRTSIPSCFNPACTSCGYRKVGAARAASWSKAARSSPARGQRRAIDRLNVGTGILVHGGERQTQVKSLLVTGSSGLIGSEVVAFFCQAGWQVHGVDNNM